MTELATYGVEWCQGTQKNGLPCANLATGDGWCNRHRPHIPEGDRDDDA